MIIRIKIFVAAIFLLNISCDTLEIEPLNSVEDDVFYVNIANLNAGLYGIYDGLQLNGTYSRQLLLDGLSDNCIVSANFRPDLFAFASGNQVQVTGTFIDIYQDNYVVIQRANLLLDNADFIEGVDPNDVSLIAAKAEARGLRALAYMNLAYLFGDVPFTTTTLSRDDALEIARTDRDTVIDFVLAEFATIAPILNSTSSDGRLTTQAVLGLHAKVMLYEARLGNQTWASAATAINNAKVAADDGGHTLAADYQSLFTEAGEGNTEYLFSVKFNSTDLSADYKEEYSWDAGVLYMHVHQNFADAYDYADGTDYNPANATYVGRDPRLSVNIMHEGVSFDGVVYDGTDGTLVGSNSLGSATNLFVQKFVTTDFTSGLNTGSLDVPVLRYADILLMEAEVLNETGGDAYTPLNLVRFRAGLPALAGLTQDDLRDEIIHERRVELAFEGQRWFDLVTLGLADTVINAIVEEDATVDRGFTPNRNELLPIPQTEIDANPNLTQNQGY